MMLPVIWKRDTGLSVTSGLTSESWWLKEDEKLWKLWGVWMRCSSMLEGALRVGQMH